MRAARIILILLSLAVFIVVLIQSLRQPGQTQEGNSHVTEMKADFDPGRLNPAAPPETALLGQLAGVWEAEQRVRKQDGSWSDETTKAEWRWYYILDGHAIQDDWISLPKNEDADAKPLPVGTNIRIYNPEEKQWYMAWIDKNNRRLATFTAIEQNGNIIMTGQNAKGQQVRNTFSNITENQFDWAQEWTMDGGTSWFAVSKIHCERR